MGDMPESTAKGPLLCLLDRLSRERVGGKEPKDNLYNLMIDLQNLSSVNFMGSTSIFDTHLLKPFNYGHSAKLIKHLDDNWFSSWWKSYDIQPVEPVFCLGIIKAIQEAIYDDSTAQNPTIRTEGSLPIDSYWICIGGQYEMAVSRSKEPERVLLIILSPEPDDKKPGIPLPQGDNPNISIVRREKFLGEIPGDGDIKGSHREPGKLGKNILTIKMKHKKHQEKGKQPPEQSKQPSV